MENKTLLLLIASAVFVAVAGQGFLPQIAPAVNLVAPPALPKRPFPANPTKNTKDEEKDKIDDFGFKRVVTYLGTDFILPDGCPLPACNLKKRECRLDRIEIRQTYDSCKRTDDNNFLGCVTDILPNKTNITIPVYANYCSAICYEKNERKALAKLERCPFGGEKHGVDPVIQRFFG